MKLKMPKLKFNFETFLLCVIFLAIVLCCCYIGKQEGFRGFESSSSLSGAPLNWNMGDGLKDSITSPMHYKPSEGNYNTWFKELDHNKLVGDANSDLFFFENNKFDPDCCPSSYSNSTGCACITTEQMKDLNSRGGNRTFNTIY